MKQQIKFNSREAYSAIASISNCVGSLPEGDYVLTVETYKPKRSLDANAYMWVLLGKLAQTRGLPGTTELYRNYIRECGVRETVAVRNNAVEKLVDAWGKNGDGYIAEVRDCRLAGCKAVTLYYGSSCYNTAEMSRLIELIVQDCKAVSIETMTPRELSLLCEEWGQNNGR